MKNVIGVVLSLLALNANSAPVSGQGTWETTLQGRDLDGNLSTFEAYYDTALDITWLADANYAGTTMNWATANGWAAGLNPYGSGITGWRLPHTNPIDGTTADDQNLFSYIGTEDRGYNISASGSIIGLAWGFVDGLIGGAIFAWLYNFIAVRTTRAA